MDGTVLKQREGRVQHLILNQPEKRNVMTFAMCRELVASLQDAERDESVGAILISANGPVFCSGMDPNEFDRPEAPELGWIHEELFTAGSKLTKPLICQVHGAALAAGVGLLCNAHVVIASQGTTFGLTEIRSGNWPFMIFRSLSLALGERRAFELALTGRTFGTNEALQYGLVHSVAPPFELEDRAQATAQQLASFSPELVRRSLDFVHRSRKLEWEEAGLLAQEIRTSWFVHEDFAEGLAAAAENRKPVWPSLVKAGGLAPGTTTE